MPSLPASLQGLDSCGSKNRNGTKLWAHHWTSEFNVRVQRFQLCSSIPPSFQGYLTFASFEVLVYLFFQFFESKFVVEKAKSFTDDTTCKQSHKPEEL